MSNYLIYTLKIVDKVNGNTLITREYSNRISFEEGKRSFQFVLDNNPRLEFLEEVKRNS